MIVRFLSWDWKGGLAVDEFVKAINEFHGGPVYVLALSDEPITGEQARQRWEE